MVMVGSSEFEDFLALAKDFVGVTRGISCVAAMVLHVPGMDGGSCHYCVSCRSFARGCHWGCVMGFGFRDAGREVNVKTAWRCWWSMGSISRDN